MKKMLIGLVGALVLCAGVCSASQYEELTVGKLDVKRITLSNVVVTATAAQLNSAGSKASLAVTNATVAGGVLSGVSAGVVTNATATGVITLQKDTNNVPTNATIIITFVPQMGTPAVSAPTITLQR